MLGALFPDEPVALAMAEVERQSNELLPVTERAARIAALEAKVEQLERIEETLGDAAERWRDVNRICEAVKPRLRLRGFARPAVFGAFGQVLIIGSDLEHLLFGDRIGHVLRHGPHFLRTVAPVLWII